MAAPARPSTQPRLPSTGRLRAGRPKKRGHPTSAVSTRPTEVSVGGSHSSTAIPAKLPRRGSSPRAGPPRKWKFSTRRSFRAPRKPRAPPPPWCYPATEEASSWLSGSRLPPGSSGSSSGHTRKRRPNDPGMIVSHQGTGRPTTSGSESPGRSSRRGGGRQGDLPRERGAPNSLLGDLSLCITPRKSAT